MPTRRGYAVGKGEMMKRQTEVNSALEAGKVVEFCEPCDCGSQVRHNNGGNYHQFLLIKKVNETYLIRWDDTCELTDDEPFISAGKQKYLDALNYAHRMGWEMVIHTD